MEKGILLNFFVDTLFKANLLPALQDSANLNPKTDFIPNLSFR